MKKIFLLVLSSWLIVSIFAQSHSFMTYNIRYATERDGVNAWSNRKAFLSDQIKFYSPDVFGVQEALRRQVSYLDSTLAEYSYTGVGRDDGKEKGEYSAIFYDAEKLKLIENSTFWLSETPEKVSVGWDAAMERICTYALFENLVSGQKFYVFNTHFDHIGKVAREKSADLILKMAYKINHQNYPIIIMGDLNLVPDSTPIKIMCSQLNDSKKVASEVSFGPEGTFNGFNFQNPVTKRIDYIFVSKENTSVRKYAILSDSKNCLYPSDHLPVFVELEFK